jgi:glycosyltransferase, family 1
MKVLHLCLSAFYIDGYGYQENILPRMHKKLGYDVLIVASTETYIDNMNLGYIESRNYVNEDGIPVHRIPYLKYIPARIVHKLRIYEGLYKELGTFSPDVIFMHDFQFLSIRTVGKYMKKNTSVKLFVDGHADFKNSARSFISKWVLHSIIYKYCVNLIIPYTEQFYGTLPSRVRFFVDFYGTPKSKTSFLPMGADDYLVEKAKKSGQREVIRDKYGIKEDEFLIVTGGKFNKKKSEVLNLLKAVRELDRKYKVRLLIFGSLEEGDFRHAFDTLCDNDIIQYVGWIKGDQSYDYFEASDIVVFPGLHSVLWEQAVGQGKPCIFNYMEGFTHVDIGGNCLFIDNKDDVQELKNKIIESIMSYDSIYESSSSKGMSYFSYLDIAKRAIIKE